MPCRLASELAKHSGAVGKELHKRFEDSWTELKAVRQNVYLRSFLNRSCAGGMFAPAHAAAAPRAAGALPAAPRSALKHSPLPSVLGLSQSSQLSVLKLSDSMPSPLPSPVQLPLFSSQPLSATPPLTLADGLPSGQPHTVSRRAVCWTAFAVSKQFHDDSAPCQVSDAIEEVENIVDASDLPASIWTCNGERSRRPAIRAKRRRKRPARRCVSAVVDTACECRTDENAVSDDDTAPLLGISAKRACLPVDEAVGRDHKCSLWSHSLDRASFVGRELVQNPQHHQEL
jgi:hypothetical protein